MAKIIELIYSDEKRRGEGTNKDPIRIVYQLFSKDGQLVAEYDSNNPNKSFFKPERLEENRPLKHK